MWEVSETSDDSIFAYGLMLEVEEAINIWWRVGPDAVHSKNTQSQRSESEQTAQFQSVALNSVAVLHKWIIQRSKITKHVCMTAFTCAS